MTRNDIIKHYGSITAACEALSYSRYAIWRWKRTGVPIRAQQLIEAKTNGALVASKRPSKSKK